MYDVKSKIIKQQNSGQTLYKTQNTHYFYVPVFSNSYPRAALSYANKTVCRVVDNVRGRMI